MDLVDVLQVCVRRWWFALPLLALVVAASLTIPTTPAPVYNSSVELLVLPPPRTPPEVEEPDPAGTAVNPYAAAGATVSATALSRALNARQDLAAKSPGFTYAVRVQQRAPILIVDASHTDPQLLLPAVSRVVEAAAVDFQRLQTEAGAPPGRLLQLLPLTTEAAVGVTAPSNRRAVVALLAAGLVAWLVLILALDAALNWLRRRRSEKGTAAATSLEGLVAQGHKRTGELAR